MAENNESEFGNFLAGFIIGGLVGAAVALLLAPQSGEETRTVIREKGIELKDRAAVTAEEARIRAEHALEEARLRAEEAAEGVRTKAEEVARTTRERASDLQQRGQAMIDQGKERIERTREDLTGKQPPVEPPVEPPASAV